MKKLQLTIGAIFLFAAVLVANPADSVSNATTTRDKAGNSFTEQLEQLWKSPEVARLGESFNDGMKWANRFAGEKELMVYIILGLSVLLFAIRLYRDKRSEGVLEGFWHTANWILFLALAAIEIVYVMAMGSNTLWFCMPGTVGWMWTIINFLIFGFMVFNQFLCYFNTLRDVQYNSYGSFSWKWGVYSWPAVLVGSIVLGFTYPPGILIVGTLFLIAQLIQIIIILKNVIPNGGIFPAILCVVVYLMGSIATAAILIHFLVLLIIVLVALAIISFMGSSTPVRNCPDCGKALNEHNDCSRCKVHWVFDN